MIEPLEARRLLSATAPKVLLSDSFAGHALNSSLWHIPPFDPGGSTFVGRTQFRVSTTASPPNVSKGAVHLVLDTYNPTMLPNQPSLYGTELISNRLFQPADGTGIDVTVRAKLNARIPGGIVGGIFLYQLKSGGLHDEIDTELLTNQVATGTNNVETNVFSDQPLGAGSPVLSPPSPRGRLSSYHTYEIRWFPGSSVTWLMDGKTIRRQTTTVPSGPMQVYLNLWAPASDFAQAFNAGIQPTASRTANQEFEMDVEKVVVKSIPRAKTLSSAFRLEGPRASN